MMKMILTSSFADVAKELSEQGALPKAPVKIGLITTASDPYPEHPWLDADRRALNELGYQVVDVDLKGQTLENLQQVFADLDTIFVAGGNTTYLFDQAYKSDFHELVRSSLAAGKMYIGSSAGSILAGPSAEPFVSEDQPELPKDFEIQHIDGLALVDYVILPHHPKYAEYDAKVRQRYGHKYSFLTLTDHEYRIVNS